jgi:NAD(P)-dependent dehydrogenase (short-subunit alcohol dehydrogenase family)
MPTTALVTGANKGIGFETARQLGQLGLRVIIGARQPELGEKAAARLAEEGIDAGHLTIDVTDDASVAGAAREMEERYRVLDVLVNNAAIGGGKPPSQTTVDELRHIFETNVYGPLRVTNAVLALMRKSDAPRIVNVSSGLGSLHHAADPESVMADIQLTAYAMSKTALNALTLAYAKELRGTAFKVNAVDPGYCRTDFNGGEGAQSAADGAVAVVALATLGADGPSGTYAHAEGEVPW